jgi:hypothetical protein
MEWRHEGRSANLAKDGQVFLFDKLVQLVEEHWKNVNVQLQTDLVSRGEPNGRLQVWLLIRSCGTNPTRITRL